MKAANAVASYDAMIGDALTVSDNMKLSVVWRQLDSAINNVAKDIGKHNAAMAKTFPMLKKKQFVAELQGTIEGKYIKFPDGSQARY